MHTLEVDNETRARLHFAARNTKRSESELVAQLVNEWSKSQLTDQISPQGLVIIYAGYHRKAIDGAFNRKTLHLKITSPPWSGEDFSGPSAAARSVIETLRPGVNPNRNGWTFWRVIGTGHELNTL